jgi:replicative DNA helicase
MKDRIPPQAVDIEKNILGAILIDNVAMDIAVKEIGDSKVFYKDSYEIIWQCMKRLYEKQQTIDMLTLTNELKRINQLEYIGGANELIELAMVVTSSSNIETHLRLVMDKANLRNLINICQSTVNLAYAEEQDADEIIGIAETGVIEIMANRVKGGVVPISSGLNEAIESIEKAYHNKSALTGITTGYNDINKLTGGWQNGDYIVLAGRPSQGKTAIVLNFLLNASNLGNPVGLFSLEMSKMSLYHRLMALVSHVNLHQMRQGLIKKEDFITLTNGVVKLSKLPFYIDDSSDLSILDIRARARHMKNIYGIKLIAIDYIGLVDPPKFHHSREREVSMVSKIVKGLAKDLKIPVIVVSQLNRSPEDRKDKRPILSDLRESGSIEQDSDLVFFVYRPEQYGIETWGNGKLSAQSTENTLEIILAKNRNGPIGNVQMTFLKECGFLADLFPTDI